MAEPFCTIPPNPDVSSGIGVRIAIYIQNILCLISGLWALWDGEVTHNELSYTATQTSNNLVLAFAVLVSLIVQANTLGMTNYHANLALMLSWMNNTNVFMYFILYIHHKLALQESEDGVHATLKTWVKHVRRNFSFSLNGLESWDAESGNASDDGPTRTDEKANMFIKRFVLLLGSLHMTCMAALGIWLWSDLQLFGLGRLYAEDFTAANACAVDAATIAILGQGVSLGSPTLRIISIVIYSLLLVPGINIIAPMIILLVAYIGARRISLAKKCDVLPAYVGLGVLLAINVVIIANIELTLNLNHDLQDGEAGWGFGQVLAIISALLQLPLRELLDSILASRQPELDEDLQEAIESKDFNRAKLAIERGSDFPSPKSPDLHSSFWNLISEHNSLGYFNDLRHARMTRSEKALEAELLAAITENDKIRIAAAYDQGSDLIAGVLRSGDAAGAVLRFATSREDMTSIARFHAGRPGPHVNAQGPDGKTALMLASEKGDESLTTLLLKNPSINIDSKDASGSRADLVAPAQ
ncbi:hypothetical protein BKA70DRAFT_1200805 [Coprinopsis sp. MPI-PUGE-AT-0042]|nr:hypothetical protein BKA70DRAFT_1200805 [Coprinopsis sp. MPI-PUGE-AT-0042]